MKIELKKITVRELVNGYEDNQESGVVGYGGKLDVRPPFQREFVYDEKQRKAVVDTLKKGFPLNVMYWAVRENGDFEIIDGQQRTVSIAQYVSGDFSFEQKYFHSLTDDEQTQILDYELTIYFCTGNPGEKLEWFRTVNIAGEKLYEQELRNAVYSGSWVTNAKKYFSKTGCAAYGIASNYLSGSPIRQDYLETAIKWISRENIEEYMSKNQHETEVKELWEYFGNVINWTKKVFPKYRKEMKSLEWGELYNDLKDEKFDSEKLEKQITELMKDEDVDKKSGIYLYLLTGKEKYLNIREFSDNQKRESYENQKGVCSKCAENFEINQMEADHITPWHQGGKTNSENCQMLCRECNRRKSGK